MPTLNEKRRKINKIDKEILLLLEKRFKTLQAIKKIKKQNHFKIYDKKRESALIKRANAVIKRSSSKNNIIKIYKTILSQSLDFLLNL